MNKLSKPKAFEASESILVQFGTEQVECANLLKSGIKNQLIVLLGHGGKWYEIDVLGLGIDSSHLPSFKHHVELHNLTLSDLGITEEKNVSHVLGHADFLSLQDKFPLFNYVDISKLNDYNISKGKKGSIDVLKDDLAYFTRDGISIDDYINPIYEDVVDVSKPQHGIIVETIPEQEIPITIKDSVSLQIFEKLTPEKITELQGLKINLEKIVKENPIVIIKDKATYVEAKKTAAVLLSASTSIDGSKGVEATATKYLNTFKTMLKTALAPLALIPRNPYNEQKKLIEDWDNRLLLQVQNRIKELTSVPFTYNSATDNYCVGSLVITQKDIEEKTDIDFTSLVAQGKAIVIALESVKAEQDSEISALKEMVIKQQKQIEAFMLTAQTANTVSGAVTSVVNAIYGSSIVAPVIESPFIPISTQSIVDHQNSIRSEEKEEKQYSLPNPNNKLLNELDLAHISVLEEKQYIECREYYKQALNDAREVIIDIMQNPDKTIQKSVAIMELIEPWKL